MTISYNEDMKKLNENNEILTEVTKIKRTVSDLKYSVDYISTQQDDKVKQRC